MANGIHRILTPVEINGVVVDPANAFNTQVLQFNSATGKFVPQYISSVGTDEGTAAMLASWMMGSN
jgi:hypothetical protein